MKLKELQASFLAMCFDGQAPRDLSGLADPSEAKRLLLYRDMVRWRFPQLASEVFPRTKERLGAPQFSAYVDRWTTEARPRSRFFRDLPLEIADFMLADPELPRLVRDGLALERARWWANIAPDAAADGASGAGDVQPFSLERIPVPSPSLTLLSTEHAVHLGGDDGAKVMHFAVYRKPDLEVTTRWSTPTLYALLEGWRRSDRAAIEVVRAVLAAEGRAPDAAFVEEMTGFLSTLLEEGALVGSR